MRTYFQYSSLGDTRIVDAFGANIVELLYISVPLEYPGGILVVFSNVEFNCVMFDTEKHYTLSINYKSA